MTSGLYLVNIAPSLASTVTLMIITGAVCFKMGQSRAETRRRQRDDQS